MVWCMQAFINVGVASGLLPTKGLTLPFVSYGGSALLACLAAAALLLRVDYENKLTMRGEWYEEAFSYSGCGYWRSRDARYCRG